MKKSTKIWLCIAGVLLIALGIVCIAKPAETLLSLAWLFGCLALVAGVSKLVFTFRTQAFLPNSASRMLSAILEIIVGCIFLGSNLVVAVTLPLVFAVWVMVEGIMIAIESFDYKRVGFPFWICMLLFGIGAAVLGFLGLRNPDVAGRTLSTLVGIGIIFNGLACLLALAGIRRFEKKLA